MSKHIISSSNGTSLHFEKTDEDLYELYLKEEEELLIKYYKLLRKRNGIYAGNQGKYVSSVEELNNWDPKTMENLLLKYKK